MIQYTGQKKIILVEKFREAEDLMRAHPCILQNGWFCFSIGTAPHGRRVDEIVCTIPVPLLPSSVERGRIYQALVEGWQTRLPPSFEKKYVKLDWWTEIEKICAA